MFYEGYHLGGMHIIWWFVWLIFIFWIFATPYDFVGYRMLKESPLDILKRRLASGAITTEEFNDMKKLL